MESIKKWIDDNLPSSDWVEYCEKNNYSYGCKYQSGELSTFSSGFGSGSDGLYGGSSPGAGDFNGSGTCREIDDGNNIKAINRKEIYIIDRIPTIITSIMGATAQGFILQVDFTMVPCYIAKGNGYFAHGDTLREAVEALREKIFEDMDTDETIDAFLKKFKSGEKYPGKEFFEWHHHLTGSCLMGREAFVKNHNLDLNAAYTVEEFISLCENDYGGDVIKNLKKRLEKEINSIC